MCARCGDKNHRGPGRPRGSKNKPKDIWCAGGNRVRVEEVGGLATAVRALVSELEDAENRVLKIKGLLAHALLGEGPSLDHRGLPETTTTLRGRIRAILSDGRARTTAEIAAVLAVDQATIGDAMKQMARQTSNLLRVTAGKYWLVGGL